MLFPLRLQLHRKFPYNSITFCFSTSFCAAASGPHSCCRPGLDRDDRRVSPRLSPLLCSSRSVSYAGFCEVRGFSKAVFCFWLPSSLIRFPLRFGMSQVEEKKIPNFGENVLASERAPLNCSIEHELGSDCEACDFGGCGEVRRFLRKQWNDTSQFPRRRHRLDHWNRDLSQLHAGWPLCIVTKNIAD